MQNAFSDNDEFIQELKSQSHEAFCRLVKEHHTRLVSLASSIANPAWAEEIVQEAWVNIYKGLPKFEARASLKTWLFTIVRHESIARLRKESRTEKITLNEDQGQDTIDLWLENSFGEDGHWNKAPGEWHIASPELLLEEEQLRLCIEHTLKKLKPQQKTIFQLRDMEQVSLEEICNILDLSNSNVRVLLHRARLTLMQVIENYQETGEC